MRQFKLTMRRLHRIKDGSGYTSSRFILSDTTEIHHRMQDFLDASADADYAEVKLTFAKEQPEDFATETMSEAVAETMADKEQGTYDETH